jgi:iron(III) transport system ATP-binding protein
VCSSDLNEGVIQQWDTPYRLYHEPVNRFVADFVGQGVLLPGEVLNERQVEIELGVLEGHLPTLCNSDHDEAREPHCLNCERDCRVDVLIRPDDIVHDDASLLMAEIERKAFRGAEFLYTLKLPSGARVLALVPSHHNHAIGERIGITLGVDHVVAFPP